MLSIPTHYHNQHQLLFLCHFAGMDALSAIVGMPRTGGGRRHSFRRGKTAFSPSPPLKQQWESGQQQQLQQQPRCGTTLTYAPMLPSPPSAPSPTPPLLPISHSSRYLALATSVKSKSRSLAFTVAACATRISTNGCAATCTPTGDSPASTV